MLEQLCFEIEDMNLKVELAVRERQLCYRVGDGEFAVLEGGRRWLRRLEKLHLGSWRASYQPPVPPAVHSLWRLYFKDSKLGARTISMKEAYNCFMNKDYELAIYHYRNALAENDGNAEAAFGLGASYQMLLQYDQAIEMYLKLIKNSYNRKKAVSNLLVALHHKTDKQALEILQNIDDNTPGYADILSQIGVIHMKNNDYNSALSALSKANDIAPDNALIAYNLGIVYHKVKNKDYAKHFYEQALRNDIADIISAEDSNNLYKRVQQLNAEIMDDLKKA